MTSPAVNGEQTREVLMRTKLWKLALGATAAAAVATGAMAQEPKRGGTLTFVTASEMPSYDGHIETTFGVIHPLAPLYSLLIRVNPENPSDPTDFQCDLCTSWEESDDGTTYTFKLREGVKFHDGEALTAEDVVATFQKIFWPPEGVRSARQSFYLMVDSVEAADDNTVVFKLKFPSGAFIPALASPFNWVYSKKDLDEHGPTWHQTNINGSGPFKLKEIQPGAFLSGERNPDFYMEGKPYLDGYKSIIATKMSARVQAIEGDQASIEFRGFPPKMRDDLVAALGDKITVQESDWNCVLIVTPNHKSPKMEDVRVRRALTLAIDRWGGSEYLSKIAIVKTVGGIVFPNHPLAASPEELEQIAGYGKDLEANREEARRLLKEAGAEGIQILFNNRGVDQPYKVVGTWLVDQWKQVGIEAEQQVNPSPVFYDILRKTKEFDVSIDFNCQSVINPIADISFFMPGGGSDHTQSDYPEVAALYEQILRAATKEEQYKLIREYERQVLDEKGIRFITLWWYKINPHRSYVKGWKIAPSHYLAQQLDQVWLDQ
jgi:peptide/nickel transport system substrate-binding protein